MIIEAICIDRNQAGLFIEASAVDSRRMLKREGFKPLYQNRNLSGVWINIRDLKKAGDNIELSKKTNLISFKSPLEGIKGGYLEKTGIYRNNNDESGGLSVIERNVQLGRILLEKACA